MKRAQLISRLRKIARKSGVAFSVEENRGKGSHVRVVFGDKATIVKDGEIKPGYMRLIMKQLGIE